VKVQGDGWDFQKSHRAAMQNPKNLRVYAQAQTLAIATYQLTSGFPPAERFGLVSQMRRAAVSVGSNIAEGCGRQGDRAMGAYLYQALGSLNELEFQMDLATALGQCGAEKVAMALEHMRLTRRMVVRMITALRKRSG
jgi:four helix bundle protein